MPDPADDLPSQLLKRLAAGDRAVERRLFDLLYEDLKGRAHVMMRTQPADHAPQTTALVHEAWLKLGDQEADDLGRTSFFRLASSAMRSVLVDHARARATDKRGGGAVRVELDEHLVSIDGPGETFLALDEALTKLAQFDGDMARIAELRLFGGLEHVEIAQTMGVSLSTAERAWKTARAWLQRHLDEADSA